MGNKPKWFGLTDTIICIVLFSIGGFFFVGRYVPNITWSILRYDCLSEMHT